MFFGADSTREQFFTRTLTLFKLMVMLVQTDSNQTGSPRKRFSFGAVSKWGGLEDHVSSRGKWIKKIYEGICDLPGDCGILLVSAIILASITTQPTK
ncbi:hypothetical protein CSA56_02880 [candidate division KSB3 bacterium]|uniref:Uncharacterized protein n=1 Tax=candidate division KSB3 bacterium TaxID=2044937 RepID=A0A2G6KLU8_9BACT|nr:MAG: hypothetical protein CSA56_02880 [candidate division KSB3 bacterium]